MTPTGSSDSAAADAQYRLRFVMARKFRVMRHRAVRWFERPVRRPGRPQHAVRPMPRVNI
jgi:hypothetical protein